MFTTRADWPVSERTVKVVIDCAVTDEYWAPTSEFVSPMAVRSAICASSGASPIHRRVGVTPATDETSPAGESSGPDAERVTKSYRRAGTRAASISTTCVSSLRELMPSFRNTARRW